LTVDVTIAQHIPQAELIVEAMVKAERGNIDPGVLDVLIGQPIEVLSAYVRRFPEEERQTIVGKVVFMLQGVTDGELRQRAQTKRHRGRKAEAFLFDLVTVDDLIQEPHEVHPQGGRLFDALVDVARGPGEKSVPNAERPVVKIL
jgi:hypothetical protein